MGEVKQETSPKSKSEHSQHKSSQQTEPLSEQSILSRQSDSVAQRMSHISNTPSKSAHAAMLNRAPALQQTPNRHLLLQLQRQYGNNYVQQVVQQARQSNRPGIQTKLTLGAVGDKYEQEADRVAKQVVNSISAASKQPVQRMKPEEEELAQMKPDIQRLATSAATEVDSSIEDAIQQARGSGQSLAENVRVPMEQAFGADFSGVRVHTDQQSNQLNQLIQAKAFTTGQDIFFRQGEYNSGSREGQELLAHELTHVVQQNGRSGAVIASQSLCDQPMVMRFAAGYTHEDAGHGHNAQIGGNVQFLDQVIVFVRYQRVGSPRFSINDGQTTGTIKHYVPSNWISKNLLENYIEMKTRKDAITKLTRIMWSMGIHVPQIDYNTRVGWDAWVSNAIDLISDWEMNLYRWERSTGDSGGTQKDEPYLNVPPELIGRIYAADDWLHECKLNRRPLR